MKKLLFLLFTLSMPKAFSEYRVYQYYVRTKIQNLNPTSAEIVTSTLNPVSYIAYHGGAQAIEVNLLRSWLCMGNTAKRSVCSVTEGKELEAPLNVSGVKQ